MRAGAVPDGAGRTSPASTAPAGDHGAELARDGQVLAETFPTPTDAIGLSLSQVATGTDTAAGWQVQGFTSVAGSHLVRAGAHQVHLACVGSGSLTVTTRPAAGTVEAPLPASTTSGSPTSLVLDCTPAGVLEQSDFSTAEGDSGVEVVVVPAAGTVAVAGCAVS